MNVLDEALALVNTPKPKNVLDEALQLVQAPVQTEAQGGIGSYLSRNIGGALAGATLDIAALNERMRTVPQGQAATADQLQTLGNTIEAQQPDQGFLTRNIRGAARSLVPTAIGGALAGTPGAIAAGVGIASSQAVTAGREAGLSGMPLARYVVTQGALEGGIEAIATRLGLPIVESLFGKAAKKGVKFGAKEGLKRVSKVIGSEIFTEDLTTLLQNVSSKYEGVDPNALSMDRIVSDLLDTTIQSAIMGGTVGGTSELANNVRYKIASAKSASRQDMLKALDIDKLPNILMTQAGREQVWQAAREIPAVPPTTARPPRPQGMPVPVAQQTEPLDIQGAGIALPREQVEGAYQPSQSAANLGNYQPPQPPPLIGTPFIRDVPAENINPRLPNTPSTVARLAGSTYVPPLQGQPEAADRIALVGAKAYAVGEGLPPTGGEGGAGLGGATTVPMRPVPSPDVGDRNRPNIPTEVTPPTIPAPIGGNAGYQGYAQEPLALEQMTIQQLELLAKKMKLKHSGSRRDMVNAIRKAQQEQAPAPVEAPVAEAAVPPVTATPQKVEGKKTVKGVIPSEEVQEGRQAPEVLVQPPEAGAVFPADKPAVEPPPVSTQERAGSIQETNLALREWRTAMKKGGIRQPEGLTIEDLGGKFPPGIIRKKGAGAYSWDQALQEAERLGLVPKGSTDPSLLRNLFRGSSKMTIGEAKETPVSDFVRNKGRAVEVNETEMDVGDLVYRNGEWLRVNQKDNDGTILQDGEPVRVDNFDTIQSSKPIKPGDPGYEYALEEYQAQEAKKPKRAVPSSQQDQLFTFKAEPSEDAATANKLYGDKAIDVLKKQRDVLVQEGRSTAAVDAVISELGQGATVWYDARAETEQAPKQKKGKGKRGATDKGQRGGIMIGPVKSPTVYLREAYDAIRKGSIGEQLKKMRPTGQTGSKALKESEVQKQGKIARHVREAGYALTDLDKAFVAEYGTPDVNESVLTAVRSVLHGGDIAKLPKALRVSVRNLRNKIDSMSKALIASGAASDELAVKISDNIGTYVTRAYKAHVDPNYDYDTMPEVHRETYRKYLKSSMAQEGQNLSDAEVEGLMRSVMHWAKGVEGVTAKSVQGFFQGNTVAKNLGIFMKKDETLSEEFRNFLGEIKDPRAEFIITTSKMANLLEAHNHLKRMKDIGLGTFFFEKPTGDYNVQLSPEKYTAMLVEKGKGETQAIKVPSKLNPWSPLTGEKGEPLYTTEAIARELADVHKDMYWALDWYMKANSMVKAGFTVGNPLQGYVRNFLSNPGFLIYAGHFPFLRHFSTGWKAIRNDLVKNHDTPDIRALNLDLAERGLQDTDPRSNEILMDVPNFFTNETASGEVEAAFAKAFNYALARYNAMDNVWKKQLYLLEVDRYYKHEFGKHPESYADVPTHIKDKAAYNTRMEMPNFLYLSKFVKALRGFPGKGMFVTFPAEVMRITYNNFTLAADDIRSGRKEIAAQRISGMALTAGIPTMMSALSKAWFDVDDEEEEAIRSNLAPWDQNTTLLFYGRNEKGEMRYVDIGFMDPWNYMRDALRALGRGEDWTESFYKGMSEFLAPFLGTESLAGSLLDVAKNKKPSGGDVYNAQLPWTKIMASIGQYVFDKNQPGAVRTLRQAVDAWRGNVTHGQKITFPQLVASQAFGTRVRTMDAMNQFGYTVRAFDGELKKANEIFLAVAAGKNRATDVQLRSAWNNAESARKSLFKEMRKQVENMRVLGYQDPKIYEQMNATLSKNMTDQIWADNYQPYSLSDEMWGKISGIGDERREMVKNVLTSGNKQRNGGSQ